MKDDKRRLYRTLNVGLFGFVEDDFAFSNKKAQILLDFARMDSADRAALLSAIPSTYPGKNELVAFSDTLSSWVNLVEWQKMPEDDLVHVLQDFPEIKALYDDIPEELWGSDVQELFFQYAVGAKIPPNMRSFFSEVIRTDAVYQPTRIFTNYVEEIRAELFAEMTTFAEREGKSTVLVLDNMVGDARLAAQMVADLKQYYKETNNTVYATIFSTAPKGSARESCESSELYIGYTDKKDGITGVHHNIIRAAINTVIQQYKRKYKEVIDKNCDMLAQYPDLVEYLYGMARAEGEAGYDVLQQWISFMFNYDMESSDELVKMMNLSACIDAQEFDTSFKLAVPHELAQAASSENFATAVNTHCSVAAPGDIFTFNDQMFVLVGQDCDYMMGPERTRNAPHCELVLAELVPQDKYDKLDNDHKYVYVSNYLNEAKETCVLKINYTKRCIISNEILNLCAYNLDGSCKIDYEAELDDLVSQRVQPYLLDYYSSLQEYFKTVVTVQEKCPEFYATRTELNTTKPLIDINQYESNKTQLDFGIRRVARLRRTASLYLYKMFLEYRGRMPYTSINLTGYDKMDLVLEAEEKQATVAMHVKLTNNRKKNQKDRRKLAWYVSSDALQNAITEILGTEIKLTGEQEYVALPQKTKNTLCCENGTIVVEKRMQDGCCFATVKSELKETADVL